MTQPPLPRSSHPSMKLPPFSHAAAGRAPARQVLAKMCDVFPDVAEGVRAQVAHQPLWGAPSPYTVTDEGTASEDEKVSHTHRKRGLKCGEVVKRVQWPPEMVFTSEGQLPVFLVK